MTGFFWEEAMNVLAASPPKHLPARGFTTGYNVANSFLYLPPPAGGLEVRK